MSGVGIAFLIVQLPFALSLVFGHDNWAHTALNKLLYAATSNNKVTIALCTIMILLMNIRNKPSKAHKPTDNEDFAVSVINKILATVIALIMLQKLLVMQVSCRKDEWIAYFKCYIVALIIPVFYVTVVQFRHRFKDLCE